MRKELEKELLQTKGLREEVEKLRKNSRNRTDVERCIEETLFRFEEIQQLYEAEYIKQNKMKKQLEVKKSHRTKHVLTVLKSMLSLRFISYDAMATRIACFFLIFFLLSIYAVFLERK